MNNPKFPAFDPAFLSQASQQMMEQFSHNLSPDLSQNMSQIADPNKWLTWFGSAPGHAFAPPAMSDTALKNLGIKLAPESLEKLQKSYTEQLTALWQDAVASRAPTLSDKRFNGSAWLSNPVYGYNAAVYLLNAHYLTALVDAVDAPLKTKRKIGFAVQQMIDAMSPSNFLATNPVAQQLLVETKGESLTRGMAHLLADMQKGKISQTDEGAFELGKDVATTEGSIVFENALFQLIQYKPLTKTVHERPLLIMPPCINKFYIMDLQPQNSLVRYAVEQGHTVFLISWCNADESTARTTWDQYVEEGGIQAVHVAQEISGQKQINALGFCVGGTILSTALAVLYARGEKPVASLTLLTALLDFTDTGILDVYIDEAQIAKREQEIGAGGLMPGRDFASAFSSLRPNDLIWNYVESNYLKGEEPAAFDLLYWNADSTNLPGPMFCYYLRNMYLNNALKDPGRLTVAGEKLDLGKIAAPTFIYASREDHIVPWTSAYASTTLLNPKHAGQNRFVLGASGHIAGVINPPAKNKRSYWTNPKAGIAAEKWLDGATEHPGSWWTDWSAFLAEHAGKKVAAPKKPGTAAYKLIEPAPGRYVKVRAE
ncbi:class I poly(R)-hydroxyalkanoic acid synthase [Glaciimonas sp. PAMC28666]|uniref:class I poly(R)-hydroxyalkanoic acid synthase n=1 Tax=Glaciimonas sp. PAMC28666 TaxID=2807626 RepID=UPI001966AB07|nr:class I poly(R)-hydroxyalkanoic acid synthase [Glaciimonas sp. PAMC28666]QRX82822.1 class I poly(R)-hydroxyalkanoic acid synthase [Glaciimonas sp. PAMC28666]